MKIKCPYCSSKEKNPAGSGHSRIYKRGRFKRSCDQRVIRRYFCSACKRGFSGATLDPFYRSRTRHLTQDVYAWLSSNATQRRIARTLKISRGTVQRKLLILGRLCEMRQADANARRTPVQHVQFDDLETFEQTKMKPLSVTIAVADDRLLLATVVSVMPANGLLAEKSRKKYGERKDERAEGRRLMFNKLLPIVSPTAEFRSDQNPHYPADLKAAFPFAKHQATKGRKPRDHGQGELKKGGFDPLFSLNHTCASFRANVNRLIRKTWCTTKLAERLSLHMHIYADYHNQWITTQRPPEYPHFKPDRRAA